MSNQWKQVQKCLQTTFFSENQGHIDIIWIKMDLTYSLTNSERQMF